MQDAYDLWLVNKRVIIKNVEKLNLIRHNIQPYQKKFFFTQIFAEFSSSVMKIRQATEQDFDKIWPIFHEIVSTGETYAYPVDTTKEQAQEIWLKAPRKTFVAEEDNSVLGTYYIKTNQAGPGSHVCNCGYMVSSAARGRGLATSMCEHSQVVARELGYKAMQFNFVASTNEGAIRLWTKLGFETVGKLPKAFCHPSKGYVDALVMYKWL